MLRRAAKLAYRQILILRADSKLSTLASQSASGKLLAEALRETFAASLSPQERAWIDRIEALRRELDQSHTPITIIDYGAGTTTEVRTQTEMEKGSEQQVTIGEMSRISKYEIWVLILHKLIRKFAPEFVVELGTAVGISAAYQAAALHLNGHGRLVTLEGAPALAELSVQNLKGFGLNNFDVVTGRFQDTLTGVLAQAPAVGYAFIDGHHDGDATIGYFNQIYPHLADRAVLVFDDIFYYASMRRAWNTLASDPRVHIAVDLSRMGVCVVDKTEQQCAQYRIPMV